MPVQVRPRAPLSHHKLSIVFHQIAGTPNNEAGSSSGGSSNPPPAGTNLVEDGGFESVSVASNTYVTFGKNSFIGSWKVTKNNVNIHANDLFDLGSGASGSNHLDINGPPRGRIEQVIDDLVPNEQYTLTFDYAKHTSAGSQASMLITIANLNTTHVATNPGNVNWASASYTFTASSTSETLIFKGNGGNGCCGVLLDEVSIVANNTSGGGNSGGNNGGGSANNDEVIYWTANEMNAEGQITSQSLGNNVTTLREFNPETGLINSIETSATLTNIQDETYNFDTLGNLIYRDDALQGGINETFIYDNLNRLKESNSVYGQQLFTYDALGNIKTKHGISGTFEYNGSPHGVTKAGNQTILYDTNGNVTQNFNFTAGTIRTLVWSSYNKPINITQGSTSMDFRYGAGRELFFQKTIVNQNDNPITTYRYSINPLFEIEEGTLKKTYIHYLRAGNQTIGIYKEIDDLQGGFTSEETRYLHRDHLGSIVAITDETAGIVERFSFDAFGKRRRATWEEANEIILATTTKRAFTGHRNLDEVGIVHMGGRVYDPELGRFLSADPFIQEVGNQQNFNRYSYVLNNPLSYTDPSGFFFFKFFKKLFKVFGKFVKAVTNVVKAVVKNIKIIASVGIAAAGTALGCPACGGFAAGFISSGGDLKAALIGALTAQAFSQLHGTPESFGGKFIKVLAHGTVGGISNTLQGGDFVAGFVSAGTTQAFSLAKGFEALGGTDPKSLDFGIGDYAHNATIAAIVGGTTAVLAGGKFKNGAITGAFSRLFNDLNPGQERMLRRQNRKKPTPEMTSHAWGKINNRLGVMATGAVIIPGGQAFAGIAGTASIVGSYLKTGYDYMYLGGLDGIGLDTNGLQLGLDTGAFMLENTIGNKLPSPVKNYFRFTIESATHGPRFLLEHAQDQSMPYVIPDSTTYINDQ